MNIQEQLDIRNSTASPKAWVFKDDLKCLKHWFVLDIQISCDIKGKQSKYAHFHKTSQQHVDLTFWTIQLNLKHI